MACYHFCLKVDRKPDKTAISAATHADYINRDGSFANIDFQRELKAQTFSGCVLVPAHRLRLHKTADKAPKYLYRSIYGSIMETSRGIEFTQEASTETKQIALALARHRYGEKLDLTGPLNEVVSLLHAGRDMDYPVEFSNPAINKNYLRLLEENHHGNSRADDRGRTGQSNSGEPAGGATQDLHLPHLEPTPRKRPSAKRASLRTLLQRNLDEIRRNAGMLLQADHAGSMEQPGAQCPATMRRDFRWGTRRKVDDIASRIWAQADGLTPASHHADYINRREAFATKGGCIYTQHHLPKWANNDPKTFFQAADKYERANGTRYREIEFALPKEISTAGQREIIDTFIQHHLADHYYAYAIHDKIGIMSNGEHNTHVHIMFSEREIDEVEKTTERPPELFFHRSNRKHPERGGCPKAAKWIDKNRSRYLCEMRQDFAEIQNAVLEKYQIDERVDHRSLKKQYQEALKRGDIEAALLLDRLPEEHLGPNKTSNKKNAEVVSLMEYRAYKFQRSQLFKMIENLQHEHASEFAQEAKTVASEALLDQDIHSAGTSPGTIPKLAELQKAVQADYRTLAALEKVILTKENAYELAMEQVLSPAELAMLRAQKKLTHKLDELKKLRTQMLTREDSLADNGILDSLTDEILLTQEKLAKIKTKAITPAMGKQIAAIAQQLLKEDKPQQRKLWQLIQKLNGDTKLLKEELNQQIFRHIGMLHEGMADENFTAQDINIYLREEIHSLKFAIQRKSSELDSLKKRLITPARANLIAQSVYLKGAPKRLRLEMRQLQKEASRIAVATTEYKAAKANFDSLPKPKWYQSSKEYEAESARVASLATVLQERQKALADRQAHLQDQQLQLEAKCNTPEAKEQISRIAAKVLKKDQPNQAKAAKLEATLNQLQERLKDVTLMHQAIKDELTLTGPVRTHKEKTGGASARRRMEEYAQSRRASNLRMGGGLSISLGQRDQRDFEAMDEAEKAAQEELSM